jgi:prepilin-type N-terminal cleavage/methylation domain-containing protein
MTHPSALQTPPAVRRRSGLTLIEVMVAMVILATVVLAMGAGNSRMSQKVSDASGRSRAQAFADVQIGRARAWPTYATLSALAGAGYNTPSDGLSPSTVVAVDTTGGRNITRVTVTITGTGTSGLRTPIIRSISIAAP